MPRTYRLTLGRMIVNWLMRTMLRLGAKPNTTYLLTTPAESTEPTGKESTRPTPEGIGFVVVGLRRGYQAAREVVATAGARLVAVADVDVPRAQQVATELGCARTGDYRSQLYYDSRGGWRATWQMDGGGSIMNQGVDAVDICTPNQVRLEPPLAACEAGKHVLVQKPMARSLAEARQLHEQVKQTGRPVRVPLA